MRDHDELQVGVLECFQSFQCAEPGFRCDHYFLYVDNLRSLPGKLEQVCGVYFTTIVEIGDISFIHLTFLQPNQDNSDLRWSLISVDGVFGLLPENYLRLAAIRRS